MGCIPTAVELFPTWKIAGRHLQNDVLKIFWTPFTFFFIFFLGTANLINICSVIIWKYNVITTFLNFMKLEMKKILNFSIITKIIQISFQQWYQLGYSLL